MVVSIGWILAIVVVFAALLLGALSLGAYIYHQGMNRAAPLKMPDAEKTVIYGEEREEEILKEMEDNETQRRLQELGISS